MKEHRGIFKSNDPKRAKKYVWQRKVKGKLVRNFFRTLEEAIKAKNAALKSAKLTGADVRFVFNGAMQREYFAAKEIVGKDVSLARVAAEWQAGIANRKNISEKQISVEDFAKEYVENADTCGLSEKTRDNRKHTSSLLCKAFGKRKLETIASKEIIDFIRSQKWTNATKIYFAQRTIAFFQKAVSAEYLLRAPKIDKSLFGKPELTPVPVYSIEETKRILSVVAQNRPDLLAFFVLRVFCGLRTAEASRMRWEWIDEARKRIVVPASICKTREDWVLQSPLLPETVFYWLSTIPRKQKTGKIKAIADSGISRNLERKLGFKFKPNAFRHTFCTMHISLENSAEKTALLLRHKGTHMLYKHYLAKLVPPEDAKAFFAIRPFS